MPFASRTFDAIICIRMLHLFPVTQWGSFVNEMRRVLKPGGLLLVEFDSALAGFGWGMIREVQRNRQGRKHRYYLWPHQTGPLFAGMDELQAFGFWIPGIGQLARRSKHLTGALRLARLRPPYGYLGNHVLVRARKPLPVAEHQHAAAISAPS